MISNMPNLESWVDIANIGVVIALALSFVFGGASIFFSRRLGKQKEAESVREKRISDEKITAANAVAETAKSDAANARTEAIRIESEAKEKIAKLTAEAERAKAERAEADKQIAIAKANAARANEGAAKATAEVRRLQIVVANAERKRAEAERDLALAQSELQRVVRSVRTLDEQAAVAFLKNRPKGTVEILYANVSDNIEGFAFELALVLKAAGWNVRPVKSGNLGWRVTGVQLVIWSTPDRALGEMTPEVRALWEFLTSNVEGLGEVRLIGRRDLPEGSIFILIGPRF